MAVVERSSRKPKKPAETPVSPRDEQRRLPYPVVGMGASAGGLDAFQRFFSHMPADSGMAFVLVPHLDAHHRSAMVELLRPHTGMTVVEIGAPVQVEPDHVYVIPPNATLSIGGGVLRTEIPRSRGMTIDPFLRSLAEDQGENAIGIILSGTGSDGTAGLMAIKEHGGLTFAQSSSAFDGMPRSAAAAGNVDFILPAEEIPARLVEQARHLSELSRERKRDGFWQEIRGNLPRITTLLRSKTGHDFAHYKEGTCIRRVQRRMQIVQLTSARAYVELLRKDRQEAEALFHDLLIGVTQFFRDKKAFDALNKQVIPKLFEGRGSEDQIRIWVPGCATGEEAYSIAILLGEEMLRHEISPKVQIFATDVDEHALAIARNGVYPDGIARDLTPQRLRRYFIRHGISYRINKEIRDMCVFSLHNLLRDAPFSKLHLISCRNLLIYFDAELQARALSMFHFALRQRGFLFLGPSESITPQPKLFAKVDSRARLFKARGIEAQRFAPEFPLVAAPRVDVAGTKAAVPSEKETMTRRAQRIVEAYAPAAVVIDEDHDILHFSGRTGRYLQPTPGAASLNLFNIVDSSLRPDLRAAINRAMTAGQRIVRENLRFSDNGTTLILNIVVEPVPGGPHGQHLCVVVFQEVGTAKPEPRKRGKTLEPQKDDIVQHLESELIATRQRLQSTIEELETSNEEMKSSNEEFLSVNEELQSSNEELETSREELQSINEELETVNAELNSKVASLDRALNDRKNLLESTQIASIFLDGRLRIKSFTPAVSEIFRLIDADVGRPLTDISARIAYDTLLPDVERVLRDLSPIEREVASSDAGATYIMRVLPYRTVENVIDGVVVTFVDISERKRNEESLARLAAIVANSPDAMIGLSTDGTITSWNAGAQRLYGYSAEETVGRPLSLVVSPDRPGELPQILERLKGSTPVSAVETERVTKDGRRIHVSFTSAPIRSSHGELIAAAVIERDITERMRVEEQLRMLVAELNHRVKNSLATVLSLVSRTRKSTDSLDEFHRALDGRLRALATTHDVLAKNVWAGAELREIVRGELGPYDAKDAMSVAGPDVFVSARAAVVLGMVFHELATNAAKHGALAAPGGSVQVNWTVTGEDAARSLVLDWRESGGSAPGASAKQGFGIKFIERSVPYELQGAVEIEFPPRGLHAVIRLPFAEILGEQPIIANPATK